MAPNRSQITGLLLAGGRGARMGGVDKGWVPFDGQPLVRHVFDGFAPQVGSLLLSANRSIDCYQSLAAVVTDADAGLALEPFRGPRASVAGGFTPAITGWLALSPRSCSMRAC